ncbi:MAG: CBS domain-containing protein [Saprospiraceae bacterium]|nr:CBS domain-containing protein [Candidatus Vicinibacter affinis]
MMNETVGSIMTTKLLTVSQEDSLQTVKEILINNRIHHVPVVEGKMVGLVTTYDLFKLNVDHKDYEKTKVGNVMTKRLAFWNQLIKLGLRRRFSWNIYFMHFQ